MAAAALSVAVSGCKSSLHLFDDTGQGSFFSKPLDVFHKPDWAIASSGDVSGPLSPNKPVAANNLVSADGRCAPAPPPPQPAHAAAPPAPPPPDRPVGSIAGDLARAPMPAATYASVNPQQGGPAMLGGVALGMSECDVVRRAGLATNVNIRAGEHGGRQVVLTYLSGPWPGIYTFDSGRLKVVDAAPAPPAPPPEPVKTKKAKAKKKPAKPKTATREIEREFVQ
ncbi:MAG: hypothetical protein ACREB8_12785 [Pseudolabrys sp.]